MWDEKGNIDELKPPLVIKPIFGCEVYFTPGRRPLPATTSPSSTT